MADLNKLQVEEAISECIKCKESSHELLTCKSCSERYHYEWVETEKTECKDIPQEIKLSWICPECDPQDGNDDRNKSAQVPTNNKQEPIINEKISCIKAESHSLDEFHAFMKRLDDISAVIDYLTLEAIQYYVEHVNKSKKFKKEIAAETDEEKNLLLRNEFEQFERDMAKKRRVLTICGIKCEKVLLHLLKLEKGFRRIELKISDKTSVLVVFEDDTLNYHLHILGV